MGEAIAYLFGQSPEGLARLFWFTLVFDIPRYVCAMLALGLAAAWSDRSGRRLPPPGAAAFAPRVSVMVAGHNEMDSLERCVRSLHEQSRPPHEIVVVSDGSNDAMQAVAARLVREGLATCALATDLRGGKSAAMNLAMGVCTGDILVNVDCDCSFDRFMLEELVAPLADPRVGGVSGDIAPRNGRASLIARVQVIEYLVSISAGRRAANGLDQVSCISGACGAFRRTALAGLGGFDVGGGEDLDMTLRMRLAGWKVVFASHALCHTDVPARFWSLFRQRLRWERDGVRVRFRKHARLLSPCAAGIPLVERFHQAEALVFEVIGSAVFPFYLVWLGTRYGDMSLTVLVASQVALLAMDVVMLSLASIVVPRPARLSDLFYLPAYSFYAGWIMRGIRLLAHAQEWFLFGSVRDNYVPAKVRSIRKW